MCSKAVHIVRRTSAWAIGLFTCNELGHYLCKWPPDITKQANIRSVIKDSQQKPLTAEDIALEQLAELFVAERSWEAQERVGGEMGLCKTVQSQIGYVCRCSVSAAAGAGNGIFISGVVPKGRVLSAYAGHWRGAWTTVFPGMWRSSEYLLSQSDGSSIDGALYTAEQQRCGDGVVAPSACAQLVNHPPPGIEPNADFLTLEVPPAYAFALPVSVAFTFFDLGLRWLIGSNTRPSAVTVLVSLQEIRDGQEVFVDYGFPSMGGKGLHMDDGEWHCTEHWPAWYRPCSTR